MWDGFFFVLFLCVFVWWYSHFSFFLFSLSFGYVLCLLQKEGEKKRFDPAVDLFFF